MNMDSAPLHLNLSTAPNNGSGLWIKTRDDLQLRVGLWTPEGTSRGTVFFFPGRGDYIELYGHAVSGLVAAGYCALAIDWRGHGLSDRITANPKTGHVSDFSDYQTDVSAVVSAAEEMGLPRPWFLVAHSMGACIGVRSLVEGLEVEAAALSAPMLGIHMAAYEKLAVGPLTWFMGAIGKGHVYVPGFNDDSYVFRNAFEGNTLTNDKDEYDRWIMQGNKAPELHTGGPSMAWLNAAMRETKALAKLPSPSVRCMTFCGDEEVTVDVHAIHDRMDRWKNGTLEVVPKAKHELFLERPETRDTVIGKIIAFFDTGRAGA